MKNKLKPLKEGKTEATEKKIIQDTGRRGQTETPERVIRPPQKSPKEK
jgi:hypothetical protein